MTDTRRAPRQPISPRVAEFLKNAAQSIEMVGIEIDAHGLADQAAKLQAIAKVLRNRKTQ